MGDSLTIILAPADDLPLWGLRPGEGVVYVSAESFAAYVEAAARAADLAESAAVDATVAAGFCTCGEFVGHFPGGTLRPCPLCDLCRDCGGERSDCECGYRDDDTDDLDF